MNKHGFKKRKNELVTELRFEKAKKEPDSRKIKQLNKRINYYSAQIKAWIPKKKVKK